MTFHIQRFSDREFTAASEHDANARVVHRGLCVELVIAEFAPEERARPIEHDGSLGVQVWAARFGGADRVVRVDGVADEAAADAALVDTARAWAVWDRLTVVRRGLAVRALLAAAEALEARSAEGLAAAGRRPDPAAYFAARAQRDRRIQWALQVGAQLGAVKAAAGVHDTAQLLELAGIESLNDLPPAPPLMLGIADVAERSGVAESTIRQYRTNSAAGFPPADDVRPAWEWETIETWLRLRRGRGWAAGTTADAAGRR
jgi:hypothetical protein